MDLQGEAYYDDRVRRTATRTNTLAMKPEKPTAIRMPTRKRSTPQNHPPKSPGRIPVRQTWSIDTTALSLPRPMDRSHDPPPRDHMDLNRNQLLHRRKCPPGRPVHESSPPSKSPPSHRCLLSVTRRMNRHRHSRSRSPEDSTCWTNQRNCPSCTETRRRNSLRRLRRAIRRESLCRREVTTPPIGPHRLLRRCPSSKRPPRLAEQPPLRSHAGSGTRSQSTGRSSPSWIASVVVEAHVYTA